MSRHLDRRVSAAAFLLSALAIACREGGALPPARETGGRTFYLNGAPASPLYRLYREDGSALPCPAGAGCTWPSAVRHRGVDHVFGAVWKDSTRTSRIGLWIGGAYAGLVGVDGSHPEVKRLEDGSWVMLTLEWTDGQPRRAQLWRAKAAEGPWAFVSTVYTPSVPADARGFSIDYWCRDGTRWLLFMSGYPEDGSGSVMTMAESSRMEGPYSRTRTLLAPLGEASPVIDGLPLLRSNVSPSSVFRTDGRWRMVGTGYGTTSGGEWYERTFWLTAPTPDGPWTVVAEAAFPAPAGLASFENAEPAVVDETCVG